MRGLGEHRNRDGDRGRAYGVLRVTMGEGRVKGAEKEALRRNESQTVAEC